MNVSTRRSLGRVVRLGVDVDPNGQVGADTTDDKALTRLRSHAHVSSAVCHLPPLKPLVDGLLYLPGESVLYSPPKLAKTFMALDLALSVASGAPFMGRGVHQGPVVFVAAEGIGGLGSRVQSWHDWQGRADYVDEVTFLTAAVNLGDPATVDALCSFVTERQAILTVLDTLARCTAGAEENSARDMGRVVEALDTIRDATGHVLVVHHAGKDTTKGMRGSSALLGAVDTVVELSGDATAIRCEVTAQKDAELPPAWWCHLEQVGTSAVIDQIADMRMLTKGQRNVLAALEALPAEDRTSTKWQGIAEDRGVSRSGFFLAKKALIDAKTVTGGGKRGAVYQITESNEEGDLA